MSGRFDEIEANILHLRRFALALTRDADRADDLVQDTVERALDRWRLRKPGLPLRPWLFAILRNLHVSAHRKAQRQPVLSAEMDGFAAPEGVAEGRVELARVLRLLHALPADQHMAILLVSVEGFSYAEAAAIMKIPRGTLMSRLSRGRKRLRELVETPPENRLRRVV